MKILGVIPARFASTRFPGKPLVFIKGKTMIQRVYEGAKTCAQLDRLVVATEDERIFKHVESFGGEAMLTSAMHQSGTERCGEVLEKIDGNFDLLLNIQGDEPFIDPSHLELVIEKLKDPKVEIASLAIQLREKEDLFNPNCPKVVLDKKGRALIFTRQALPFQRGLEKKDWQPNPPVFKHIGLYGFQIQCLKDLLRLDSSPLERAESLEQLRWMENGYDIHLAITNVENHTIDTPEDLEKLKP